MVLIELHKAHSSIVKTKSLARPYVWWPEIGTDIEYLVKLCLKCCSVRTNPPKNVLQIWHIPNSVWQRLHF